MGVLLLFGLSRTGCPAPCAASAPALAQIEQEAVRFYSDRGFSVRVPTPAQKRPTGSSAGAELTDVAGAMSTAAMQVDRVVALDLERDGSRLWVTHYLRGVPGVWGVHKAACTVADSALSCGQLQRVLEMGLRPRTAKDVDLSAGLRGLAPKVSVCVRQEDRVPIAERIFGKIELDLELRSSGTVRVIAIAPARVARAKLGACLRSAMESLNMGPFEGQAIPFRIPIDL